MKKFCTIIMLVLFLLNVLGFYGVFLGLQFKYAQEANDQLDAEQYSNADAVTFRIPLTVPYSTDHQDYERVSGEFEHDGEVYRLVKQKLFRDTLYIVCVKDNESKKINQALVDYVKTFSDKPVNAKQHNGKQVLSFIKDYVTTGVSVESQSSGWYKTFRYEDVTRHYLSLPSSRIKYPPRNNPFL
ncbi:MAG TPA: hypothetical protein VK517_07115 [Cyclobacteriaceae bacterium]|nr:hypothetical protein [Cyclobacteriaceae bacterium]